MNPQITDLPPHIAAQVDVDPVTGEWVWAGPVGRDGYGRCGDRGAHRVIWEHINGPVEPGHVLDHREDWGCTAKRCVWPVHLLPVTIAVNTMREGTGVGAINAAKEVCDSGHEFDLINTYWRPSGARDCRACIRGRVSRYKARVQAGQHVTRRTLARAA